MTEALIWLVLRWVAITTLGIFLAWLIVRVLRLFLGSMGDEEPDQTPPPVPPSMPAPVSERYLRPGVWIETNWGGMGGGLSGWRVSNAIIYLLVLFLLLGCLSLAVVSLPGPPEKSATVNKPPGAEQKPATANESQKTDKKDADQKAGETKTSESSVGVKNPNKSSELPAAGKQAEH